jgi:drug/metabolite transporter (DMT)-like permease
VRSPAHIAFVVLGLVWGSNFVFMKWAAAAITPGQTTLLRVLCGFLPVLVYALARGALAWSHLRHAHHFLAMSVLATSVHYFAYAAGASLLDSGIAGALSGAIPLFALVAAALLLRGEPVTPKRILGVCLGFGGVLVIARPWATGGGVDLTGVLLMVLGSASIGLSFAYAKRFLAGLDAPAAALTTYQLGFALVTLAAVTDLDGMTAIGTDTRALVGVVAGLGLAGTGVAYVLYYVVVERLGALAAANATYLPPVVALLIGWLLVGEPVDALDGAAVLLILAGVAVGAMPARVPRSGCARLTRPRPRAPAARWACGTRGRGRPQACADPAVARGAARAGARGPAGTPLAPGAWRRRRAGPRRRPDAGARSRGRGRRRRAAGRWPGRGSWR